MAVQAERLVFAGTILNNRKNKFLHSFRKIIADLNVRWVVILSQDSYYRGLPESADPSTFNFDHPDAFDYGLMAKNIQDLKDGRTAEIPQYSFVTHSRYLYCTSF